MRRAALTLIAIGGLALLGAEGGAYVPTRSEKSGRPLRWTDTNCVILRPHIAGSVQINDGTELTALLQAMTNWHRATAYCSYLRFRAAEPTDDAVPRFVRGGYNENAVFFVEQGWRHDPSATALTTVKYVSHPGQPADGKILDADIELNADGFSFSTAGDTSAADLEAVLTHELGHVIGLDHPCDDGSGDGAPRVDDAGQPIPGCVDAPPEMRATTMFNFADPGEQEKRTPEADDARGVCEAYPLSETPGRCAPLDNRLTGGCAVGRRSPGDAGALALLLLLATARRLPARRGGPWYHHR